MEIGKFGTSDSNESSLIGAMVDGAYDQSMSFQDYSALGDGKSLK
jgi:hypothetical protein